ncbi:MAG: purine-nucleoside phosphorylase [Oscillospiraceae bacterium]|nr:purine-nucleoside phosphorylase [Oscillospiraceae bacterium]
MTDSYSKCQESAKYILERAGMVPEIGIILGSSLGPLAQEVENPKEIPYTDIPHFLRSTAPGHAGKLVFGKIAGKNVVCMSGRFHSYEGYDFTQLAMPIRVMKLLGVQKMIVTNAAGGVNMDYRPGDVMIINDHIMFSGFSPMRGENATEFGPRFFDTTTMYTPALREIAKACAKDCKLNVHEGVYFFMQGPQFETPAEIRAIRTLGGDAVGMSTVTEALTAAHCGMPLLGLSLITNMAAGILAQPLSGEEVDETGARVSREFSAYVKDIISKM